LYYWYRPACVYPPRVNDLQEASFEQLAEERLRDLLVPLALHQDVEDIPLLIDSTPQVMALALERQKYLVKMPRIPRLRLRRRS
jgi:hypothetical protein